MPEITADEIEDIFAAFPGKTVYTFIDKKSKYAYSDKACAIKTSSTIKERYNFIVYYDEDASFDIKSNIDYYFMIDNLQTFLRAIGGHPKYYQELVKAITALGEDYMR